MKLLQTSLYQSITLFCFLISLFHSKSISQNKVKFGNIMLLLVEEVKKRTQFLNSYIGSLQNSISKRRYNEALNFISQQRPAINHTNVTKYNPNTFAIDSLKTKNENLTEIKNQLLRQKSALEQKLTENSKNSGGIKQKISDANLMTFMSRIQISLRDVKRVEFQPMAIQSDYENLILTSHEGRQTILPLEGVKQTDKKSLYLLVSFQQLREKQQFRFFVILKFVDQSQMVKWHNVITFGKMVQQAKGKRYLFLGSQNQNISKKGHHVKAISNDQNEAVPYSSQIQTQRMGFRGTFVPEKQQQINPQNGSLIRQKEGVANLENSRLTQQQKQITNSLFVSPNDNLGKKSLNNYATFRPTPLNRIRGKSMYLEIERGKNYNFYKRDPYDEDKGDFFQDRSQKGQKSSQKNNFRKASQDITLKSKSPIPQQHKLQKFRSQRNLVETLAQSNQTRQLKKGNSNYHSTLLNNNNSTQKIGASSLSGNSRRIQKQLQKKQEFLQRVNFNFQNNGSVHGSNNKSSRQQNKRELQMTAKWFNQEDLMSQSIGSKKSSGKSQFSNYKQNGFPKQIVYKQSKQLFEEQLDYSMEDQSTNGFNRHQKTLMEHQEDEISEAPESHEISPTFPKKIAYEDGSHIRLYPVQFTDKNENTNNRLKSSSGTEKDQQNFYKQKNIQHNEQKENVLIEPLDEMEENDLDESRQGIRNDRLNTLDSQTDKDERNGSNEIDESNSSDHHEQEEFEQLIEELKKGLVLTKCPEGSFWTREKQIKLSQNENTLLVIDVKDKKIKKLPISDIDSVQYGKFSKGIIKHIPQIEQKKCLIINAKQGKTSKKIQFVGNNPQKLAQFTQNLVYFVQMFKSS